MNTTLAVVKPLFITLLGCLCWQASLAQAVYEERSLGPAGEEINTAQSGHTVSFSLKNMPEYTNGLPNFQYLWIFGDGQYSEEASPTHTFRQVGNYTVMMLGGEGYSQAPPPPTLTSSVNITQAAPPARPGSGNSTFASGNTQTITMKSIHHRATQSPNYTVVPNKKNICVVAFRNNKVTTPMAGKIVLFYNETTRSNDDFLLQAQYSTVASNKQEYTNSILSGYSNHPLSQYLPQQEATTHFGQYRNAVAWDFNGLGFSKEANLFLQFHTQGNTQAASGQSLHYKVLFLPQNTQAQYADGYDFEMAMALSRDPNIISASTEELPRKKGRKEKAITYTVHFQNEGEAPAQQVVIKQKLDPRLKPGTLKATDWYHKDNEAHTIPLLAEEGQPSQPYLQQRLEEDSVVWTFHHINLPGTGQPEYTAKQTIGHLTYTIEAARKRKRSIGAQAQIIFDRNSPLNTNTFTTRVPQRYWHLALGGILGSPTGPLKGPALNKGDHGAYGNFFLSLQQSPSVDAKWYWSREASLSILRGDDLPLTLGTLDIHPFILNRKAGPLTLGAGLYASIVLFAEDANAWRYHLLEGPNAQYQPWGGGAMVQAALGLGKSPLSVQGRLYANGYLDAANTTFNHKGLQLALRYRLK